MEKQPAWREGATLPPLFYPELHWVLVLPRSCAEFSHVCLLTHPQEGPTAWSNGDFSGLLKYYSLLFHHVLQMNHLAGLLLPSLLICLLWRSHMSVA